MEDLPPFLQYSETDGTGSVRRRRPALSCVECRKRKVKCDRAKPCGPCTKTKSPTCSYRPAPQAVGPRARSPAGNDESGQSSPHTSTQTADFNSMLNRYIAPGILGPHGSIVQSHLPTSRSDTETTDFSSTIESLVEKVRQLEGKLESLDNRESLSITTSPRRQSPSAISGQFAKSKFFGETHWVNCIEPYEALGHREIFFNDHTQRTEVNKQSDLYAAVGECKRMARVIKAARKSPPVLPPEIESSIPPKDVCDQLVQCYLLTLEGIFRVLHIPTFLKEYDQYWKDPDAVKPSVLTKIILVWAIGVIFFRGEGQARLRASSTKWIEAAEHWLSGPHGKSRLNLTGIQIHILTLLARQVCSVDGDLIWISAGALLRSAMHLGLHREPSHFPKISAFNAEMRRRLWATVLEVTVQSSLDMGMPPLISLQDFDTRPPSNIQDEDISEDTSTPPRAREPGEVTQTSIQIAFGQTLPIRLETIRLINNLRSDLSYDDALRLGAELMSACRTKARLFHDPTGSSPITPFQVKLFDTLVRRFVLCLHRPFFVKAKTNPKYYYSRKLCLETSLTILAPASQQQQQKLGNGQLNRSSINEDDDWTRFTTHSVGFYKSFCLYALTTVYLELLAQVEELRENTAPLADRQSATLTLPPQTESLRSAMVVAGRAFEARVANGETNIKGIVFIDCALAQVDAFVSGVNPDDAVLRAARTSIANGAALMRKAYREEWGAEIDLGGAYGVEDREHGSDDVSSRNARNEDPGRHFGGIGGGEGVIGDYEVMDWETLMQDESLDFGFGFESGPENWYLGG